MKLSDLSDQQRADLRSFLDVLMRPAVAQGVKYIVGTVRPMLLGWENSAGALVSSLDAGEVIPNTSSLVGAQDLTREDILTLMTGFINAVGNYTDADTQKMQARACGAPNMVMN